MNDAALLPFAAAPFASGSGVVRPEWIDSNDHMNLAYYIVLFDTGTDGIYDAFGMDRGYKARTNCGTFATEAHTLYEKELLVGDEVQVRSLLIGADEKRLHIAHEMFRVRGGMRAAMQEIVLLHVNLATRRVVPWPADVMARLREAEAAHAGLRPSWIGRHVGQPRTR
jgi:acyl-CoA thioester hydrolase